MRKTVWSKNDVTYEYNLIKVLFWNTERIMIFICMNRWMKTYCKFILYLVKLESLLLEIEAIVCVFVGNLWKICVTYDCKQIYGHSILRRWLTIMVVNSRMCMLRLRTGEENTCTLYGKCIFFYHFMYNCTKVKCCNESRDRIILT